MDASDNTDVFSITMHLMRVPDTLSIWTSLIGLNGVSFGVSHVLPPDDILSGESLFERYFP